MDIEKVMLDLSLIYNILDQDCHPEIEPSSVLGIIIKFFLVLVMKNYATIIIIIGQKLIEAS